MALAIALATILAIALATWGFAKLARSDAPHVVALGLEAGFVIALAFIFSVVLAIGAAFVAAPAVAGDAASGIVLAVLPRPVSRTEYVVGKWLGTSALVAGYAFAAGGLALGSIAVVTGYVPPHPLGALGFLAAEAVAALTLALAFGTRLPAIAAGLATVALFGAGWIGGMTAAVAGQTGNDTVRHAATLIGLIVPTDVLWRGAVYELEPVAALVAQTGMSINPMAVTALPNVASCVWIVLWFAAVLGAASFAFVRRDL